MAELTLHRVLPDDWEVHRALRLEMLRDAPDAFCTRHDEALALDEAAWREQIANVLYVQAWDGAGPVATVGLRNVPDSAHTTLISMYVAPRARGQRVGERLVQAVVDEARVRGIRRVVLEVMSDNPAAKALYQRAGFRFTGRSSPHPRRPDLLELEMEIVLTS